MTPDWFIQHFITYCALNLIKAKTLGGMLYNQVGAGEPSPLERFCELRSRVGYGELDIEL